MFVIFMLYVVVMVATGKYIVTFSGTTKDPFWVFVIPGVGNIVVLCGCSFISITKMLNHFLFYLNRRYKMKIKLPKIHGKTPVSEIDFDEVVGLQRPTLLKR